MVTTFHKPLSLMRKRKPGGQPWKNLLLITLLLASLSGCVVHEPSYQIIYTPDKTLTNGPTATAMPLPELRPEPVTASCGGVEQQGLNCRKSSSVRWLEPGKEVSGTQIGLAGNRAAHEKGNMKTINAADIQTERQIMPVVKRWRNGSTLVVKLLTPAAGPRLRKAIRPIKRIIPISRPGGFGGEVFFDVEISTTSPTAEENNHG